jgi:hypothetical protein
MLYIIARYFFVQILSHLLFRICISPSVKKNPRAFSLFYEAISKIVSSYKKVKKCENSQSDPYPYRFSTFFSLSKLCLLFPECCPTGPHPLLLPPPPSCSIFASWLSLAGHWLWVSAPNTPFFTCLEKVKMSSAISGLQC